MTGGAGFIGSNFVHYWFENYKARIVNLDKLTYAGNVNNLTSFEGDPRYVFVCGDIADRELVRQCLARYQPEAVVNFAAESHVDRSIVAPDEFIRTNVIGTFALLEEAKAYWKGLSDQLKQKFRFVHVSTDEVYGSLGPADPPFQESTPYAPNSPYAASKAASDQFARAYFHTYGLPVITTNCSNNYGPYQFPEKLIPLMILNALAGQSLPVYGDGLNVRDWLYVKDHCRAICAVLRNGRPGETYNIGGRNEKTNLEVIKTICSALDELRPKEGPYFDLVNFVKDRPGHDRRYAIDCSKIEQELGWNAEESFSSGLKKTVEWYLQNSTWVEQVRSGSYRSWIKLNYEQRNLVCEA